MLIQKQRNNLKNLIEKYKYNFQYLRPPPQVLEIQIPQQQYFVQLSQGKRRRIYYKVKFSQQQIQAIKDIRVKMAQNDIFQKFPDQLILKHLATTYMDQQKALQRLQKLQKFHNDPIITQLDDQTIQKLKSGLLYAYGRDRTFKPILILRVDKLNTDLSLQQNFNVAYYLMLTVYQYMMVPYHADKINLIVDLNDMSLSKIPYKYMTDIINLLTLFFCCSTQRTFVFNSGKIGYLWKFVSHLLPQHAKKKIFFVNKGDYQHLFGLISPFQLQQKYGGHLKNLKQYWPPKVTSQFDRVGLAKSPIKDLGQQSETQYYSIQDNQDFFQQTKSITCGSCGQCQIF